MATKKSLQKLTIQKLIADFENEIPIDHNVLSKEDVKALSIHIVALHKNLSDKGDNKKANRMLNIIEPYLAEPSKNWLWESNHRQIVGSISNLMQQYNRMPSPTEIANECGLSRQTVTKHIANFKTSTNYLDECIQFEFMKNRVLTTLFNLAVQGDVQACKYYLQFLNAANNSTTNNYIQINGLQINQTAIQNLNLEQMQQITQIITESAIKKI
jgi:hypothetical protein